MLIDYVDLVEQLKQFRLDVIKMLAEQNAEIHAIQAALIAGKPATKKSLELLQAASQKRLSKFEEYNSQHLALLHERREGH